MLLEVRREVDVADGVSVGEDEVLPEEALSVQVPEGVAERPAVLARDHRDREALLLPPPLGTVQIGLDLRKETKSITFLVNKFLRKGMGNCHG